MKRALASLGYALLGVAAAAGVALSAALLFAATDFGRNLLVPRLVRVVDDAIAGRIELRSFRLLTRGGIELNGLRIIDPDGDVVLDVGRARAHVDIGRIRSKTVSAALELEQPSVVLKREEDGGLSIARAFAPTHPKPKTEPSGKFDWTIRLTRLMLRGGTVRYVDAAGATAFAAESIDVDARGAYGPGGARLELALGGAMTAPEKAPLAVQVAAGMRGNEVRVRQLRASAGDTALDVVGHFDWVSWRGRAAVLALSVNADEVRGLAPRAPLGGDLAGTLYVESNGAAATAALDLRPDSGRAGTAHAAAALRLPPADLAAGFDLALDRLDLARVLRGAPSTALALTAAGHAQGKDLATLRGALSGSLAPSRVRGGRVGPAELRASAADGAFDVSRLEVALPGAAARGRGTFRPGGKLGGHVSLEGTDLGALHDALAELLARPLPAFSGDVRIEADVGGTQQAPTATLHATSSALRVPGARLAGLSLGADASGSLPSPSVRLDGTAERVAAGKLEILGAHLQGQVAGRGGDVTLVGAVPQLGRDPLTVAAAGSLSDDGRALGVTALTLSWPGDRFELAGPVRVSLAGPSVDRLALVDGPQRITVEGGVSGTGRRRALDVTAAVQDLDLARLPLRALVPPRFAPAGRLSLSARATGPAAAPRATAHVDLAEGAVAGVTGLSAAADLGYDGAARRATVDLGARRAAGGEVEAKLDVPVALARAPGSSALSVRAAVRGVRVTDALELAHRALPLEGVAAAEISVSGTVAHPQLAARATLSDARWEESGPIALTVSFDDGGDEGRLVASADWRGARAADVEVRAPLATARLLRDPGPTARALATAPLAGAADVPGLDLASLAGAFRLPPDLRGRLTAHADLSGTARAPRGAVKLAVADGAIAGYERIALDATLGARDAATELSVRGGLDGNEVARLDASLASAVERLGDRAALDAARVAAVLDIQRADLRRAGAPVPLAGEIRGKVEASGTVGAPRLTADLAGQRLEIAGHPLGELAVKGRSADGTMHAELRLDVASGGHLDGSLDVAAALGLETARSGQLARAPAKAKVVASELDLGVLPALAPGRIRTASGKLGADLVAQGPLSRLAPKGTLALKGGRVAVAEYGDWKDIEIAASLSEDALHVDRLAASSAQSGGRLEAKAQAVGLARKDRPADLTGEVNASGVAIPHGGQDLATLTTHMKLKGTLTRDDLAAEVQVHDAVVKLPPRPPRKIQPLGDRDDIVIAPFQSGKKANPVVVGVGAAASKPYHAKVHVVAPNQFWVKSDSPRIDAELKADLTAEYKEAVFTLLGDVETLRGQVEPIGGRQFDVKQARVHFVGSGDPKDATLEVEALYTNPAAKVTVQITGTIAEPEIKLTSDPPMDEGQIALLIATGRTELKANSGGATSLSDQATSAAATAASVYFGRLVAEKLPVDSVQVDASQLRAGKYLTDKLYVGYTRRFNANPDQGENANEVRLEYQITPRWTLEGRAGDAGTGGGSLIWSKDY